jgi:hypothetical protein
MAKQQRVATSRKVPSRRTSGLTRVANTTCNDAMPGYTTAIDVLYGDPQPRNECEPPTPAQKGAALDSAKKLFKEEAAAYCAKGTCPQPSHLCVSAVTFTSVQFKGVVSTDVGTQKRCALRYEITGNISCTCSGES